MKVYYDYEDKRDYEECDCREEKKYYKRDYDKYNNYDYKKYDKRDHDKCDYYDKKCCDEHKYEKCCPKNPCPYPIIFECAQGTGATIAAVPAAALGTTRFAPRSLGCLTIDTTCLKNPVVKFDFTSIIKYVNTPDAAAPARITFELCKQCDNGDEICCGNWDFVIDLDASGEQITTSYSFSFCECNSCPGCCTYFVRIVDAFNPGTTNILEVCNTTLSAIAKSAC